MAGKERHLMIIGKERPFDEERWQQLLTAFAYVLHEQRREAVADSTGTTAAEPNDAAAPSAPSEASGGD